MKKVMGALLLTGALLATTLAASAQDAWLPGLASLVVPGAGQFLNDQVDKAILHLGIAIALDVGAYYISGLLPFGYLSGYTVGLAHLAWGLYSAYDAYTVAEEQGFTIGLIPGGVAFAASF